MSGLKSPLNLDEGPGFSFVGDGGMILAYKLKNPFIIPPQNQNPPTQNNPLVRGDSPTKYCDPEIWQHDGKPNQRYFMVHYESLSGPILTNNTIFRNLRSRRICYK